MTCASYVRSASDVSMLPSLTAYLPFSASCLILYTYTVRQLLLAHAVQIMLALSSSRTADELLWLSKVSRSPSHANVSSRNRPRPLHGSVARNCRFGLLTTKVVSAMLPQSVRTLLCCLESAVGVFGGTILLHFFHSTCTSLLNIELEASLWDSVQ